MSMASVSTRIGVWGWSGGGSTTLNLMFRYPEIYQTGMSVAPVPDERLYDTIYQERYMGLPSGNPEGYRDGSPITFAGSSPAASAARTLQPFRARRLRAVS